MADASHDSARLRVLAEVSHAFAKVVTDYRVLLETIATATADLVGDGCLVTLVDSDGETLVNIANAHRDPTLEANYRAYLAGLNVTKTTSAAVAAVVLRTGTPMFVADVDPRTVVAGADDELKPLVERLNVHSYVVVPIHARKKVIGTLSLFRSRPDHGYSSDDMTMLQDVADRAGLAIDNARLYGDLDRLVRQRTAELETMNLELEAFSYSVAHDLRAPLRTIDGFSQVVLDDCRDRLDPSSIDNLMRVRRAAMHMEQLIESLLGLSRLTRVQLERVPVDVSAVAYAVVQQLRDTQPTRQVDVQIAPGLRAYADRHLVGVLLTNLVGNAWKFTARSDAAKIEIGQELHDGQPMLYVRDNGAGFDMSHATSLFVPFRRLHAAGEFEGTGIGLATVQRIVARHGGVISAQAAVDGGATFWFTLAAEP